MPVFSCLFVVHSLESFRFWDENEHEYGIFSLNNFERARKPSFWREKRNTARRHFSTRFCKNFVLSKQVKNTVAAWHFSISKKAQLPAIGITEQPILLTKSKINRPG